MAASITPRSAIRKTSSLSQGYAELPMIETEEGPCWILPGNRIVTNEEEAKAVASHMDSLIQANIRRTGKPLL